MGGAIEDNGSQLWNVWETEERKKKNETSTGQVADLLPTLNNFVWQEKEWEIER